MVKKINCLLPGIEEVFSHSYYWCIDQCEFATDINFKSREELSRFYKTLVETAYFTFSSHDIYSFFGRNVGKIHTFRKGEIISDLRHRYQGYRTKFKTNKNQIKMYDKGNSLRIEVTINNPKDFKILKTKEKVQEGKMPQAKEWDGKRYSGFNLLSKETVTVLSALSSGDFILNGFDNKSIRRRIYENSDTPKIINKTTRLLAKLKAHGIIKKCHGKIGIT